MIQNIKTKLLIFLLLGIVILLIIVAFITSSNPTSLKKSTPEPIPQNKVQVPQFNSTYHQTKVEEGNLANFSTSQKLPIYQSSPSKNQEEILVQQLPLALGIKDKETGFETISRLEKTNIDGKNIYTWIDNPKHLVYIPSQGYINYSAQFLNSQEKADEVKALDTALSFLTTNNLLPEKYQTAIEYLETPTFAQANKNQFSLYKISIIPLIDNLPLISSKNNGTPIVFWVNRDFSIFKIEYNYLPSQDSTQTLSLKEANVALSEVTDLKIKPSFLDILSDPLILEGEDPKITSIKVKSAEVSYYADFDKTNQVVPVYKITCEVQIEPNLVGTAVYLVQ